MSTPFWAAEQWCGGERQGPTTTDKQDQILAELHRVHERLDWLEVRS